MSHTSPGPPPALRRFDLHLHTRYSEWSHARVLDHIGSSYTAAPGETAPEWLASVACGDCLYVTSPIGFPRLLSHIYRAFGRYYLDFATAEGRAGMGLLNYLAAAAFVPGATVLGIPAVLASLNEIKQRSVLALTRRSLERSAAAAAPAPIEALD